MIKKIYKYEDVKDKIHAGLDAIADPIRQTLSPKGGNVLIQGENLQLIDTNDGVTIAKNIDLHEQVEGIIVDIVKTASLKTNSEAGDGTSSTVLLSQVLTKEGLKMKDEGASRIEIEQKFLEMAKILLKKIKSNVVEVKTDADIKNIAKISANNDEEIATFVLDVVKTAGEDGMVFLEPGNSPKTELTKDLGFMIKSGLIHQELVTNPAQPTSTFKDVPVFITDKRLYHAEEAETILRVAIQNGHSSLVVVARDFIGEAVPTFIKNHTEGNIKVILVKDPNCTETDNTSLDDLAQYLDGKIIADKSGSIVNKISIEDFVIASKVYTDPRKTLFTPKTSGSKALKERIKYLREELKKDKRNTRIKERLSSLTTGVVTVHIGGSTIIEMTEKIYRYEDAVNATRVAMKNGYVVGGGISLLRAYNPSDYEGEMISIAKKFSEAITKQIAINCGKHDETVLENIKSNKSSTYGYNALTDTYGDLLKEGVIDPYIVLEMSINNAVSIANIITRINNYIVYDRENYDKGKEGE